MGFDFYYYWKRYLTSFSELQLLSVSEHANTAFGSSERNENEKDQVQCWVGNNTVPPYGLLCLIGRALLLCQQHQS